MQRNGYKWCVGFGGVHSEGVWVLGLFLGLFLFLFLLLFLPLVVSGSESENRQLWSWSLWSS